MISGRHVISLIPINFPLSKNWVPRINVEGNFVLISVSIWGWDVADIVIVVKASDVSRKISRDSFDSSFSITRVVLVVVNSSKFSLNPCSFVKHLEVLLYIDVAPVRYLNSPRCFSKDGNRWILLVVNSQELEMKWFNISERSIGKLLASLVHCGVFGRKTIRSD